MNTEISRELASRIEGKAGLDRGVSRLVSLGVGGGMCVHTPMSRFALSVCCTLSAIMLLSVLPNGLASRADEAPTILIEDVVLSCDVADLGMTSMPQVANAPADVQAVERRLHRVIARYCQGKSVCRLRAAMMMREGLASTSCADVVIVPVCAAEAFDEMLAVTSSEMTLSLRDEAQIVVNCNAVAVPHF
ncbi:MAG: hypothetical protein AAFZ01_12525 [Pseudomonadota bacterium]